MKILVLHGHLSMGGEERVLISVLKNLKELGHNIDFIITWNHKENNLFENEIPKGVNYEFLFDFYSGKNKLLKELYRFLVKNKYPKLIKEKIKKEKYDVVIDYSSNLLKYENFSVNIPLISWVHFSLTFGEKLTSEKIEKYKRQYKKYSKIIAITKVMQKEFLEKLEMNSEKVAMIYNPIDLKFIKKRAEDIDKKYEKYLKEDYFLQVSRLSEQKQPEHLIDIYYKLKKKGIKEKLYFIGSGIKNELLRQKIQEYKLENDIFLLGQMENPYPFFKNAKLFVHTAKYEGLPTVLIESMTFGTPVVAYDCPTGPKDILGENSEYGKLVPLNDKDKFVLDVLELENEEKYRYYCEKALNRAKDFSIESNRNKLKELLENLIFE